VQLRGCKRLGYAVDAPRLNQPTVFLWPQAQVNDPLAAPGGLECPSGHFCKRSRSVWSTKGAEGFLCVREWDWAAQPTIGITSGRQCF